MIWKNTKFSNNHEISETGQVRNKKSKRLLKPWMNHGGYLVVRFTKDGKNQLVHRVVAFSFLDNPYNYDIINHKDGIRYNNSVNNLEWCNKSYNLEHAIKTGLCPAHLNKIGHTDSVGSKNAMAKLDEDDIRHIRVLRTEGLTLKQIGEIFNVHFATIGYIIQGKTWSHVK